MKFRADTLLASFVVALFASFLTALAVLLVKGLTVSVFRSTLLVDLIFNIYILFFFAGFVFFKGSSTAAWLLYRHDVGWGYKVRLRQILPIFALSFVMAISVYAAIYSYLTSEYRFLALVHGPKEVVEKVRQL
ncbi:MAG: hypothetical protein HY422_00815 [Candidatus Komeilibacteria bacterium]|nr:hypothetical protein [Candidatus Komeilibacteria bacterium]